jgi:hypothetical protein
MRIAYSLAALALSGCFGFDAELVRHPGFGRATGLSYGDQASFQRSLMPQDQVAFFIYMNHVMRPPNLALRDELTNGGGAVFDEVVSRLAGTKDDFDMASLSAVLKAAVHNGVSSGQARAALREVTLAANRAVNTEYKRQITRCARDIERAIEGVV